jgi:dihydrofolate synthase/folylpolyglutamate synthase
VAITPISLDHQEYLGNSLASIAAEKAAIIRPGVSAVVAPQPEAALEVILAQCANVMVTPRVADYHLEIIATTTDGRFKLNLETERGRYDNVLVGLRGRHQITNAVTAIRCAELLAEHGWPISSESIKAGIAQSQHRGRLEWRNELQPPVLLDGAHNPAGAQALRDYLDEFVAAPITLVFGAMRDKNLEEILRLLAPAAARLILTQPGNARAADAETLLKLATAMIAPERIVVEPSVPAACEAARQQAQAGIICVTGSLYLVGEIESLLSQMQEQATVV